MEKLIAVAIPVLLAVLAVRLLFAPMKTWLLGEDLR